MIRLGACSVESGWTVLRVLRVPPSPDPQMPGFLGRVPWLQCRLTSLCSLAIVLVVRPIELACTHATRLIRFLVLSVMFLQRFRVTCTACAAEKLSPCVVLRRSAEAANGGVGWCRCRPCVILVISSWFRVVPRTVLCVVRVELLLWNANRLIPWFLQCISCVLKCREGRLRLVVSA